MGRCILQLGTYLPAYANYKVFLDKNNIILYYFLRRLFKNHTREVNKM